MAGRLCVRNAIKLWESDLASGKAKSITLRPLKRLLGKREKMEDHKMKTIKRNVKHGGKVVGNLSIEVPETEIEAKKVFGKHFLDLAVRQYVTDQMNSYRVPQTLVSKVKTLSRKDKEFEKAMNALVAKFLVKDELIR